ncbi:hypothetical protein [uncultured Methylobacterium sp.]|uniref:hypothetical protein n=1 Tax=uncultured Methylobacterium sp. TaxID=157278 RepID=UPI0035CBD5E8
MLEITLDTAAGAAGLAKALEGFGHRLPNAQALVLNRVLTRTKARVIPALTAQTGLNRLVIVKAVRMLRASPGNPRAALYTRGGNISYRYFHAREVPGGVEAQVAGHTERLSGHYFRRSGKSPNRHVVKKLNGQVYYNASGKWKGEITVEKSGVFIPYEMVEGATRDAFLDVVAQELPNEIARELTKILPGR